MSKVVVFDIGDGDFERGFAVELRIGDAGQPHAVEFRGQFPPAPEIPELYGRWQTAYYNWGLSCRWRRMRIDFPPQTTNVSTWKACESAAEALQESMEHWLNQPDMRDLREYVIEEVRRDEPARLILQTQNPLLPKLPWHLWQLVDRRPRLEIALSAKYDRAYKPFHLPVRIVAILGSSAGIDVQADRAALERLPNAKVKFLVKPTRQELSDRLFEQHWDILFFAGHSSSEADGKTGRICINETDSLTIEELRYALSTAVQNGLKLAIFNSCDGLGLAQALTNLQIPQIIVMREPVPDPVAQSFVQYFLNHFAKGESFYLSVRKAREQLQALEGGYPCASWLPMICQNPAAPELRYPQWNWNKVSRLAAIGALAFAVTSIGAWKIWQEIAIHNRISDGERILVQSVQSADKEAGVGVVFWFKDYQKAISKLESSLKQNPNDPETAIYLNNAKIGDRPSLKIAVSVPIGSNPDVAQEMLRGIAQAQQQVNNQKGIDGKLLKIEIASDNNTPESAIQIAERLVGDHNILAVVGHNSSDASVAAANQVYQPEKLVMLAPTSQSRRLTDLISSDGKNYIFRTSLSATPLAEALANRAKTMGKTRFAVCPDLKTTDQSFGIAFEEAVKRNGGKIINIHCDLSATKFQPDVVISRAISAGADSLTLYPHIDRVEKAILVARANKGKLTLFASSVMQTSKTLEFGKDTNGMEMVVPWHAKAFPDHPFLKHATDPWGGLATITWRTATTYDAVQLIVEGLRRSDRTREGLQQALSNNSFSIRGATGTIQFSPSGDRAGTAVLVKVQPNPKVSMGYSFKMLSTAVPR